MDSTNNAKDDVQTLEERIEKTDAEQSTNITIPEATPAEDEKIGKASDNVKIPDIATISDIPYPYGRSDFTNPVEAKVLSRLSSNFTNQVLENETEYVISRKYNGTDEGWIRGVNMNVLDHNNYKDRERPSPLFTPSGGIIRYVKPMWLTEGKYGTTGTTTQECRNRYATAKNMNPQLESGPNRVYYSNKFATFVSAVNSFSKRDKFEFSFLAALRFAAAYAPYSVNMVELLGMSFVLHFGEAPAAAHLNRVQESSAPVIVSDAVNSEELYADIYSIVLGLYAMGYGFNDFDGNARGERGAIPRFNEAQIYFPRITQAVGQTIISPLPAFTENYSVPDNNYSGPLMFPAFGFQLLQLFVAYRNHVTPVFPRYHPENPPADDDDVLIEDRDTVWKRLGVYLWNYLVDAVTGALIDFIGGLLAAGEENEAFVLNGTNMGVFYNTDIVNLHTYMCTGATVVARFQSGFEYIRDHNDEVKNRIFDYKMWVSSMNTHRSLDVYSYLCGLHFISSAFYEYDYGYHTGQPARFDMSDRPIGLLVINQALDTAIQLSLPRSDWKVKMLAVLGYIEPTISRRLEFPTFERMVHKVRENAEWIAGIRSNIIYQTISSISNISKTVLSHKYLFLSHVFANLRRFNGGAALVQCIMPVFPVHLINTQAYLDSDHREAVNADDSNTSWYFKSPIDSGFIFKVSQHPKGFFNLFTGCVNSSINIAESPYDILIVPQNVVAEQSKVTIRTGTTTGPSTYYLRACDYTDNGFESNSHMCTYRYPLFFWEQSKVPGNGYNLYINSNISTVGVGTCEVQHNGISGNHGGVWYFKPNVVANLKGPDNGGLSVPMIEDYPSENSFLSFN